MKIKIRKFHPDAVVPRYATDGAAGMDLYACLTHCGHRIELAPGAQARIPTEIGVAIPYGYEGQVRGRSGLALAGISATLGTIDSDYRGPIGVILRNVSSVPFPILSGDRIAQLVICPVVRAEFEVTEVLPATERGDRGFGSTGVR